MSLLVYRLFLWSYATALRLVAPWNRKAHHWLKGRHNLLQTIKEGLADQKGPTIWMHCASLGEFEQGRPVFEALRTVYPNHYYVITFFSPSGYNSAQNYKGADRIFYLPMDSAANARRMVELLNPQLVLWVKYDYWYYYLRELKSQGVPVLLISAVFRRQQAFFKWYGSLHRNMLKCFHHFFVQTDLSVELLASLNINDVTMSGDTRFDRVIEIAGKSTPIDGIDEFCGSSPVIVAGSTWEEDEEELDHFANTHPEIKFIIAPHEVDESRIKEIESLFDNTIRYSQMNGQTNANVLIIDCIGLLSRLYRYATITWVGGGFGDDGVHNVLEAAVYGKPVIFGPVYDKYIEAIELVGSGGGFAVENALEAEALFNSLLQDKNMYNDACDAAREYVHSRQGATEKIISFIQAKRLLTN